MTFNSLKHFCTTLFVVASSVLVYGETTVLEIDKQSLISTSNNSLTFKATASSGISYKGSLVCFNQEPNYKEGSIYVLKSEFHIGASLNFPYLDCLSMRRSLQNGRKKIILSWDQDAFDGFITAPLTVQLQDI